MKIVATKGPRYLGGPPKSASHKVEDGRFRKERPPNPEGPFLPPKRKLTVRVNRRVRYWTPVGYRGYAPATLRRRRLVHIRAHGHAPTGKRPFSTFLSILEDDKGTPLVAGWGCVCMRVDGLGVVGGQEGQGGGAGQGRKRVEFSNGVCGGRSHRFKFPFSSSSHPATPHSTPPPSSPPSLWLPEASHLHALRACSHHHPHLISVLGARRKVPSSCSFHHPLHVSGFSCTDGSHHTSRLHRAPFRSQTPRIVAHRRGNLSCSWPVSRFLSVTRRCRSSRTDLSGFEQCKRTGSRQVCLCYTSGMVWRRRG